RGRPRHGRGRIEAARLPRGIALLHHRSRGHDLVSSPRFAPTRSAGVPPAGSAASRGRGGRRGRRPASRRGRRRARVPLRRPVLPALGLRFVPAHIAIAGVMAVVVVAILLLLRRDEPVDEERVRNVVAYLIFPALLYCLSYASTAGLTQWIDLFHRGESLGPA